LDLQPPPPPPIDSQPPTSGIPVPAFPIPPEPQNRRRALLFIAIVVLLVVAIVAAVAVSAAKKGSPVAASSPSAPAPPRPSAPSALQAKVGPFKVVLSWSPSTGEFIGYRILRDGGAIDVVAAPSTTYTDTRVLPTGTYSYGVEAYTQGGDNSEQAVLQVKTPKAPLSAARLTGVYDVRLTPKSQFGFTSTLGPERDGWRFKPVCSNGVCDVAWNELGHKDLGAKLKRSGVSYHGTDPSSITGRCSGVGVTGTIEVTIKVTKAALMRDTWMATQIQGTVIQRSSAQLGCLSAGIDFTFTAKIVN
jgi:hypothetical protein